MDKRKVLIEYIVQDVIAYLVEDEALDVKEAMYQFYTSKIYEKLLDEETGLYLESSPCIYEIFRAEQKEGHLVQLEY